MQGLDILVVVGEPNFHSILSLSFILYEWCTFAVGLPVLCQVLASGRARTVYPSEL